jgi:hypothetical protein
MAVRAPLLKSETRLQLAHDPPKCERFGEKIMRILDILRSAIGRKTGIHFC